MIGQLPDRFFRGCPACRCCRQGKALLALVGPKDVFLQTLGKAVPSTGSFARRDEPLRRSISSLETIPPTVPPVDIPIAAAVADDTLNAHPPLPSGVRSSGVKPVPIAQKNRLHARLSGTAAPIILTAPPPSTPTQAVLERTLTDQSYLSGIAALRTPPPACLPASQESDTCSAYSPVLGLPDDPPPPRPCSPSVGGTFDITACLTQPAPPVREPRDTAATIARPATAVPFRHSTKPTAGAPALQHPAKEKLHGKAAHAGARPVSALGQHMEAALAAKRPPPRAKDDRPLTKTRTDHKYTGDVVRGKDDRAALPGHDCYDCRKVRFLRGCKTACVWLL